MDIIKVKADTFIQTKYGRRTLNIHHYKPIVDDIKSAAYGIDNDLHRTKFLEYILRHNNSQYNNHLLICTKGDSCEENQAYEALAYDIKQEINRIGVASLGDVFTDEEKETADSKLDKILNEIEKVKAENVVMYEHFKKSFEELKELHILGKRKWYEILLGKSTEMVIGGVVSETISKAIVAIATAEVTGVLKLIETTTK